MVTQEVYDQGTKELINYLIKASKRPILREEPRLANLHTGRRRQYAQGTMPKKTLEAFKKTGTLKFLQPVDHKKNSVLKARAIIKKIKAGKDLTESEKNWLCVKKNGFHPTAKRYKEEVEVFEKAGLTEFIEINEEPKRVIQPKRELVHNNKTNLLCDYLDRHGMMPPIAHTLSVFYTANYQKVMRGFPLYKSSLIIAKKRGYKDLFEGDFRFKQYEKRGAAKAESLCLWLKGKEQAATIEDHYKMYVYLCNLRLRYRGNQGTSRIQESVMKVIKKHGFSEKLFEKGHLPMLPAFGKLTLPQVKKALLSPKSKDSMIIFLKKTVYTDLYHGVLSDKIINFMEKNHIRY